MDDVIYGVIAVAAVAAFAAIYVLRRLRRRVGAPDPEVYRRLRAQLLDSSAQRVGIELGTDERVWGVLFEIGYRDGAATIVALRDGNASLYLSTGGGVIGGFGHEAVRAAALRLVVLAETKVGTMSPEHTAPPPPDEGIAQFILLAGDGLHVARGIEEELARMTAPDSDLYAAGQAVITQLRMVTENQAPDGSGFASIAPNENA